MAARELNMVVMPNGALHAEWTETQEEITKSSRLLQEEVYTRFAADPDAGLLFLGFCDKTTPLSPSLDYWRNFAGMFARELSRTPELETLRHRAKVAVETDALDQLVAGAPLAPGSEYVSAGLLESAWSKLNAAFSRGISAYKGTVADFIRSYSPDVHLVGRVFFHLVENKDDDYPFAFLATYSTRLNQQGKSKHVPLKFALKEYENQKDKLLDLLATVHLAAGQSPLLADLLETGELFHPLAWTAAEAFSFLKDIVIFENCGILCRIPNWWKGKAARVGITVRVGDAKPTLLGIDAILDFDVRLALGGVELSPEEARRLLEESEGLAFIKNRWVAVDPEKLRQALDAYEKARPLVAEGGLSLKEAMRLQLLSDKFVGGEEDGIDCEVSHGKWLESVMKKLVNPGMITSAKPGSSFRGRLRAYQQQGLNWLLLLHSLRFGACLADDMGLGKTVQVLAFLHVIKSLEKKAASKPAASLLIVPASLISNWVDEIRRFSPDTA